MNIEKGYGMDVCRVRKREWLSARMVQIDRSEKHHVEPIQRLLSMRLPEMLR